MGLYRRRGVDSIGSPIFHNYSAGAALANLSPAPAPAASPVSVNVNPALVQNQAEQPFFTADSPKPLAPKPKPPAPRLVPPTQSPNAIPVQADPEGGGVPAALATTEGEFYPQGPSDIVGPFLQSPAGKLILVGSIVAATVGVIYWLKKRGS